MGWRSNMKKLTIMRGFIADRLEYRGVPIVIDEDPSTEENAESIQQAIAEERVRVRVRGEIKRRQQYWHLQWEGCSDHAESVRRKKYNEEVTDYINGVLDDILSALDKPLTDEEN